MAFKVVIWSLSTFLTSSLTILFFIHFFLDTLPLFFLPLPLSLPLLLLHLLLFHAKLGFLHLPCLWSLYQSFHFAPTLRVNAFSFFRCHLKCCLLLKHVSDHLFKIVPHLHSRNSLSHYPLDFITEGTLCQPLSKII